MNLPPDIPQNGPIMAHWLNAVKNAVIASIRGDGRHINVRHVGGSVIIGLAGQQQGTALERPAPRYVIQAIANNYLTCIRIDGEGEEVGESVIIAKKPTLRHDASQYPGVTSIVTVNADTIDATGPNPSAAGNITERARVTPAWFVGAVITADRHEGTGLTVGGDPVRFMETTSREWGVQ
jgi:hypothetical protein